MFQRKNSLIAHLVISEIAGKMAGHQNPPAVKTKNPRPIHRVSDIRPIKTGTLILNPVHRPFRGDGIMDTNPFGGYRRVRTFLLDQIADIPSGTEKIAFFLKRDS